MRTSRVGLRSIVSLCCGALAAAAATVISAPTVAAAPICPGAGQPPVLVARVPGAALEGLTIDPSGRLYTTDLFTGRVYRVDAPGAAAVPIATVPGGTGAGALAWAPDGTLLVGYGADPRVLLGDTLRQASIAKLDVATGNLTPFVTGLSAANGMDVARDGTIYATNDFGQLIGRVYPNGVVQADWGRFPSANGAVLGADDRYLYVSRTFVNPGVSRIPTANPGAPESLLTFGGTDVFAAPDGLTLDSQDRPIVPTNAGGQVIRIDAPNQFCVLASGLPLSSVLSYGRGTGGFGQGRLFRAGFDGAVYEIPGGFDPGARTATP
ncbi:SMP-30/gluconolactonase/LRE family protein [Aldersonia sp. NBC_00410]|uniref:SMP-30/gluconolactonase/LRE family protein n=1 Tax=Aldersonia sp. NBC_00410 TaxID=2975954 RepID=UPI0022558E51|nr:SMP-30/gluconolactonase/LRE family protein [Aldersonia sp. NBC_00410]MCX5043775.1 SMP-30/gluconolactonase/LRE family protein [Aldersonia sp. NBC_00410]